MYNTITTTTDDLVSTRGRIWSSFLLFIYAYSAINLPAMQQTIRHPLVCARNQMAPGLGFGSVCAVGTTEEVVCQKRAPSPFLLIYARFSLHRRATPQDLFSHGSSRPCRKSLASFLRYLPGGEGRNENNGIYVIKSIGENSTNAV